MPRYLSILAILVCCLAMSACVGSGNYQADNSQTSIKNIQNTYTFQQNMTIQVSQLVGVWGRPDRIEKQDDLDVYIYGSGPSSGQVYTGGQSGGLSYYNPGNESVNTQSSTAPMGGGCITKFYIYKGTVVGRDGCMRR